MTKKNKKAKRFQNAKEGDKCWSPIFGDCKVIRIGVGDNRTIRIAFDCSDGASDSVSVGLDGRANKRTPFPFVYNCKEEFIKEVIKEYTVPINDDLTAEIQGLKGGVDDLKDRINDLENEKEELEKQMECFEDFKAVETYLREMRTVLQFHCEVAKSESLEGRVFYGLEQAIRNAISFIPAMGKKLEEVKKGK